jgi:hypothetical protein
MNKEVNICLYFGMEEDILLLETKNDTFFS